MTIIESHRSESKMSAVGIDLGTTNCCVAYAKQGKDIQIIQDKTDGTRVLPSYILFSNKNIFIGKHAQNRISDRSNKIYDIKRLMGKKFHEIDVDDFKYTIMNERNRLKVHIKSNETDHFLIPEEISALFLKRLKISAEDYLNNIEKAVITVPAYFNETQRKATIDAGKIAGFKEIQLLNEPTAAAIAYANEYKFNEPKTILIFDFGGGTFDVSIVEIVDRTLQVLGMGGDLNLGGNNVDANLLKYILNQLETRHNEIITDHRQIERLRAVCKSSKEQLSSNGVDMVNIELVEILPDVDIDIEIDICIFDKLNDQIYKKIMTTIKSSLLSAKLNRDQIDEIVMVGGSSKIKKINDMLRDYFQKELRYNINPDEAVATGAAIQASIWSDPERSQYKDMRFNDISTYTLGVEIQGERMSVLIPKHTPLPATATKRYQTTTKMQESVRVRIFSGESNISRENYFLGELRVTGFPLGPAGSVILKETFNLNKNGMLEVTAVDEKSKGIVKKLKLSLDESGSLTQEEIEECKKNIEKLYNQK